MVNRQLQVVSSRDAPVGAGKPQHATSTDRADPEETLRLVSAFYRIADEGKRGWLIETAERMARG